MKHPVGLKAEKILLPKNASFEERTIEEVNVSERE